MKLCIIPARGGSKRIPRKNIRDFIGKPIIAYSIETALKSRLFDKVIVSTDDLEIAEVARQFGAEIPFIRPSNIADDHATTIDVINHAIEYFQSLGELIELVCCLYATAPFAKLDDLQSAHELMCENAGVDYVFSATEFSFPIWRGFRLNNNDFAEMVWPENFAKRSQDLEPIYHDAGMFYFGKASAFLNGKPIFGSTSKPILLPHYRVQDIDTLDDWLRAEMLYKVM